MCEFKTFRANDEVGRSINHVDSSAMCAPENQMTMTASRRASQVVSVVGERKASMIDNALELIIKRQEATIDRLPKRHSAFRVDLDNDVKKERSVSAWQRA